jgi:NTP pyrophosphatase (non-canonical NTP hydrolase)
MGNAERPLDVPGLQNRLRDFVQDRDWHQYHSPKNLAMALSSEAGELLDLFRWLTEDESAHLPEADLREVALEIADIQIYLLRLTDVLGVSLAQVIEDKISINEDRYPVELSRGNAIKYNRRPTVDPATPPER